MLTTFEKKIFDELETEAVKNGFDIVNVSVVGSKKAPILKVFIDTEGGVSFEELASAQEFISPIIDEIDPFEAAYTLEVSSPGIDRPLVLLSHFERFIGSEAHVRVQMPVEERRNFNGIISSVSGTTVTIEDDQGLHDLDFSNIKRANLIGQL